MDDLLSFDSKLYSLPFYFVFSGTNGSMGFGKAQSLQERVQRKVPERKKSDVPIYPVMFDKYL